MKFWFVIKVDNIYKTPVLILLLSSSSSFPHYYYISLLLSITTYLNPTNSIFVENMWRIYNQMMQNIS